VRTVDVWNVFSGILFSRLLHLFHGGFGFLLGNSVTFLGKSHVLDELGITTEKGFMKKALE